MRRLSLVAAVLALAAVGASAAGGSSSSAWSAAATIRTCGSASDPRVVFPYSLPSVRSGHGAILWLGAAPSCPRGGATALVSATLHSDDQPSLPRALSAGAALSGPLAAAGTTAGQIVAVAGERAGAVLGEAPAGYPLAHLQQLGGPADEVATADGWIGDADVVSTASLHGTEAIELRAQRHYARSFAAPVIMREGTAQISSLTVAMDFRADSIVLWVAGGDLHAQWVSNNGRPNGPQVLGPAGYDTQIGAVLSDNNRAFVIWTDQPAPGRSGPTTIFLDHSGSNVVFASRPRVLTTFTQPSAQRLGPGAVALVRETPSEGVLAAWTLVQGSSYVVAAAGLTSHTVLPAATIAQQGADLRLAALATGPHDDVVAVLERAPRTSSGFDSAEQAILAARTVPGGPGGVAFGTPAQLAAPGPNGEVSVAVDPDNDEALVAWQTQSGGSARVAYAVRSGP
jgi:hypothetical protein